MSRSRTTLARTEAAATDAHLASPSTIGRTRPAKGSSAWRSRSTGPSTRSASGTFAQPGQGPPRRHPQRLRHPPLVALGRGGVPDRPRLAPRADGVEDLLAACLAQHLGVAQPGRHGAELDPGAHHRHADGQRPGPRTAPDLVEAGHRLVSLGAQAALLLQVGRADRHRDHHRVRLIPWGRERRRGGGTRSDTRGPRWPRGPRSTFATATRGRGCAASRSPRSPRTGTASGACPTGARWASSFSRDDVRRERTRQGFWWH